MARVLRESGLAADFKLRLKTAQCRHNDSRATGHREIDQRPQPTCEASPRHILWSTNSSPTPLRRLEGTRADREMLQRFRKAPLLLRLLDVARAYLAPDADIYSGKLLRLVGRPLEWYEYIAGMWHHDRVGRSTLKCMLYLQRQTRETHPFSYAVGSHTTFQYSHDDLTESRYADREVRRRYPIMTDDDAQFGDGVCFDPNGIHRADPHGSRQRDVLLIGMRTPSYGGGSTPYRPTTTYVLGGRPIDHS
jgi:hypothetical protein